VRGIARWWANWHAWCARNILGIRTVVEGPLPRGPLLVAGKHQSMFEPMELVRLLDWPGINMKEELSRIPVWGRLARIYGLIAIDRAGGATALRSMVRDAPPVRVGGASGGDLPGRHAVFRPARARRCSRASPASTARSICR
jgi:1-acyl-sn-glycerol-3-phosphate acyltransferase